MTLCDAGPLFALVDTRQSEARARCVASLPGLRAPLITTWPCLTEAMYLTYREGRWPMQQRLWRLLTAASIGVHVAGPDEVERVHHLMEAYRDTPMDLADASIVAAAETLQTPRIFSIDSDFLVYRYRDREAFEVTPGPLP